MEQGTLEELFHIALRIEKEALDFYERLAVIFDGIEVARDFFAEMARDEASHARGIELLMANTGSEALSSPAPLHSIGLAKSFLNFSAEETLATINNLQEAYQATVNLEFSEANKLHELLFELHADKETRETIATSLRAHQDHVTRFRNSGVDMSCRA